MSVSGLFQVKDILFGSMSDTLTFEGGEKGPDLEIEIDMENDTQQKI